MRRSDRFPWRVVFALVAAVSLLVQVAAPAAATVQVTGDGLLVYHQLTNRPQEAPAITSPVLSADGKRAVFTQQIRITNGDPENADLIELLDVESGESTEIDWFPMRCPPCFPPYVDISADGATVVSSDRVEIHVAGPGRFSQTLAVLGKPTHLPITGVRITGDGKTVFFLLRYGATTPDGETELPEGLWMVSADGDEPRLVAGAEEIAAALGLPAAELWRWTFFGASSYYALDASDDGSRVAFGAFGVDGDYLFEATGDGTVRKLAGPVIGVLHVAVSGDGQTLAYATLNDANDDGEYEYDLGIVGGDAPPRRLGDFALAGALLQLSADGSRLLLGDGRLIDVATATTRPIWSQLHYPFSPQMTMNADATRVLFLIDELMVSHEQLGLLALDPTDLGEAPRITEVELTPAEIPLDGTTGAGATVHVSWEGQLIEVWLQPFLNGYFDPNLVGTRRLDPRGLPLKDTLGDDPLRGEGVFSTDEIRYAQQVEREDDTGPRTIRVVVVVESADGRRHSTALDVGTVTVVA